MLKNIIPVLIIVLTISLIATGSWFLFSGDAGITELAKITGYSRSEIMFLKEQGFLDNATKDNVSNIKPSSLIEQNLNTEEGNFEVLAVNLDKDNYEMAFKLENKTNQDKDFYIIPVSNKEQFQFKQIQGLVNNRKKVFFNKVIQEPLSNLYDVQKHKRELNSKLAQAYNKIEQDIYSPSPVKITLPARSTLIAKSQWEVYRGPSSVGFLEPVYLLVYGSAGGAKDELSIINVHSSPQKGDDWEVYFTTRGTGDLKIIPADQATIDDDEFVGLFCDDQKLNPQILENDVIYYPNWNCFGKGKVVHYTKKAGKHTLRFEFNGQVAYAYNDAPTEITTWAELHAIRENLSGSYILMNNLDENSIGYSTYAGPTANSNTGWLPIGTSGTGNFFAGIFDGQGYTTISDLHISRSGTYYQGLFGYTGVGSEIKNIGIVNVNVTGDQNVGGLSGAVYGSIINSYSTGSVNGSYYVGGLVGYHSGSVENSYSTSSVSGINTIVGGLVGYSNFASILNSYATGNVNGTRYLGGLVGYNYQGLISNSYSTGSMTRSSGANTDYFGGFAGRDYRGKTTNSYSIGSVHYEGATDPINKGFFGAVDTGTGYEDSGNFWNTETSGQSTSAGNATGKIITQMKTLSTFTDAAWNIVLIGNYVDETWYIDASVDYPRLGWELEGEAGNNAPTISSVEDYPDPLIAENTITFSVDWADADAEGIKMYICKAEDGTTSGCGEGGTWCSNSDDYDLTDPIVCTYPTQSGDVGSNNYYAYVCDDEPSCSAASAGTFTVDHNGPGESSGGLRIRGDGFFKIQSGLRIKSNQ